VDATSAVPDGWETRGSPEQERHRGRAAAAVGGLVLRQWAVLRGGKRGVEVCLVTSSKLSSKVES
jgi:hypothetical protein